ncbi:2-C-methyl-D-erythritol 4-phosphate cytidylyltransferase [candidate division WOR-1 bacterium RIFCSPHIGHO2_01_FULL_53_15]|uniref:2-C-methyl-D-erythritol 4-phosphate cytidylyltransferase n=1 Tax=candidate division WOR-1 bacterium RIFCSPHIGHO2_01_FULL_53_15 TaxID=1802564 RepID=A0A1F4Q4Q1_UNCSA|nr:MAG: 2-C-methyl-D-erythritol 4-phosphate cytidylyltransferase [candidate division WOR-1 bacterium RIFCSPHIGHO2_01_FULL_53_15]OGC13926.1 MAG: 2-C-methyl-D-erythritol 4-phosphate cytidylyltransferase [candidate division WOR-1 bacterium RIFCSPHIGHO2_02_FULL_53_26]
MKTIAIIVAGGRGKRLGRPKQFLKINGKPMLAWTVNAFQQVKSIDGIIIVAAADQLALAKKIRASKVIAIVAGGARRQDSVRHGLAALPKGAQIVLIHDGARPAVTSIVINKSIKAAREYGAAIAAVPVKDTLKIVDRRSSVVSETFDRDTIWAAQTPQTFTAPVIKKAYERLEHDVTDDAMAVEQLGIPVRIVMGSYENIKVTTPEDLAVVGIILKGR